jgi:DNA-binding HxlR family transcriptional regulator
LKPTFSSMYKHKIPEDLSCGIVIAMKVFGAKWKPCILDAIRHGYKRPSEMHKQIADATPRVIDMQLQELENIGIVEKKAFGGFPLRTEYNLTEIGKTVLPIIDSMEKWGRANKQLFGEDSNRDNFSPVAETAGCR